MGSFLSRATATTRFTRLVYSFALARTDNGRALRLAPPDGRSPRMVTGHFNLGEWPRLLQLHGLPASPCNAENRVEAFEFLGSGRSRPCGMMVPRRSDMADHSLYNVPGRTTLIPLEAAVDFTLGRRAEVGRLQQLIAGSDAAVSAHSRPCRSSPSAERTTGAAFLYEAR
jgi:hypothetical protein